MRVKYIRVSTTEQNTDRQEKFDGEIMTDMVSGRIEFKNRPRGMFLWYHNSITEIVVHSIDRLGRDTLDILNTLKHFTSRGVNIVSEKEGFSTIVNGKENPVAKMMIGFLATLAEFELSRAKERQAEGILEAKRKGVYTGRKKGTQESIQTFMSKASTKRILKYLKQGESIQRTALLSKTSTGSVKKVKRYVREGKIDSFEAYRS